MNKGAIYEQAAVDYVKKNGFRVLQRNYRTRWGEIDIIAKKKGRIHFIEVKGRAENAWFSPEESVRLPQLKRIFRCAQVYSAEHMLVDTAMCISMVGVSEDHAGVHCHLLEDIYEPKEF